MCKKCFFFLVCLLTIGMVWTGTAFAEEIAKTNAANMMLIISTIVLAVVSLIGFGFGWITNQRIKALEKEAKEATDETKKTTTDTKNEAKEAINNVNGCLERVEGKVENTIAKADSYLERIENKTEKAIQAVNERLQHAEDKAEKAIDRLYAYLQRAKALTGNIEALHEKVEDSSPDAKGNPSETSTEAAAELLKQPEALIFLRAYAIQAIKDEKWQEALGFWESILDAEPKNPDALFYVTLSLSYILENERSSTNPLWDTAKEYFARAAKIDDSNAVLFNNWAGLLIDQSKLAEGKEQERFLNEAEVCCKEAIRLKKSDGNTWDTWAMLRMAQGEVAEEIETKKSLWGEADDKLHKATKLEPNLVVAWDNWATLRTSQAKIETNKTKKTRLLKDAAKYRKIAIRLDPSLKDDAKPDDNQN